MELGSLQLDDFNIFKLVQYLALQVPGMILNLFLAVETSIQWWFSRSWSPGWMGSMHLNQHIGGFFDVLMIRGWNMLKPPTSIDRLSEMIRFWFYVWSKKWLIGWCHSSFVFENHRGIDNITISIDVTSDHHQPSQGVWTSSCCPAICGSFWPAIWTSRVSSCPRSWRTWPFRCNPRVSTWRLGGSLWSSHRGTPW